MVSILLPGGKYLGLWRKLSGLVTTPGRTMRAIATSVIKINPHKYLKNIEIFLNDILTCAEMILYQ